MALLRGINLGKRNVKMERLREIFIDAGFEDVTTYIASGNVIFSAADGDVAAVTRRVEEALREALGYEVAAILRTDREMVEVARYEPFPEDGQAASLPLQVAFMPAPLAADTREAVLALATPDDGFRVHGREIYWLARNGVGRSTAWRPFEKLMAGQGATVRNARTVRAIAERFC